MNTLRFPSHGPATRAAHALNGTLNEIAAGVRGLVEQADTPPTATNAEPEEGQVAGNGETAVVPAAVASPVAPAAGTAGVVSSAVETRVRPALPSMPDLGPEVAALTAAMSRQHAATVQALRLMIGLCQSQQQQLERMAREIETLTFRLNRIPY